MTRLSFAMFRRPAYGEVLRRVAELEAELEQSRAAVEALQGDLLRSDKQAARHAQRIARLQQQVDTLKSRLSGARTKASEQRSAAAKKHRAQVQTQRAQIADLRRASATQRMRSHKLMREVAKLPRHGYGSFMPGVPGWQERWDDRAGKRVLLFAPKDYSGSAMKWAIAVNRYTDLSVRCVVMASHQYGYDLDLMFLNPSVVESELDRLVSEADVIHLKDETGFFAGTNGLESDLLTRHGRPMVFTHYGGYARKHRDDPEYQEYVSSFAARVAMTPDLNFPWFNGTFIPQAIDADMFAMSWTDGRVVGHSPSNAARKGTAELIEAIDGLDVELDLITGVPHQECLARKKRSSLFFDQAGREDLATLGVDHVIGWYGNSALEAAVHGIPTMAHLSDDAFKGAERAGKSIRESCPIINVPTDSAGIRAAILAYFDMSPEGRLELSRRTRRWAEDMHNFKKCGAELAGLYAPLLADVAAQ